MPKWLLAKVVSSTPTSPIQWMYRVVDANDYTGAMQLCDKRYLEYVHSGPYQADLAIEALIGLQTLAEQASVLGRRI